MQVDTAKQELAIVRKIAQYESMVKNGRLSKEAGDSLCEFERVALVKLRAAATAQQELPISEAKRK